MTAILSIPVLSIIAVFQSAVVSRLPLNHGTADLMLVVLVAITTVSYTHLTLPTSDLV